MLQFLSKWSICLWVVLASGWVSAQDLELQSVTKAPNSRFRPGGMLVLFANVTNRGSEPAEGTVVTTVDGVVQKETAVQVRVPPGEVVAATLYVPVPQTVAGKELVEIKTLLYTRVGDQDVVQTRDGLAADYSIQLGPDTSESFAAFFMDGDAASAPYWHWPRPLPAMSYEFAIATRIDAGYTRRVANFSDKNFPVSASDWSPIDTAIIADPNVMNDAAFVEGLRRFITGGGKCWILLDRISTESVRPLLGAGQSCETLDEVELHHFVVDVIGGTVPLAETDRTVDSPSNPFKMKRVIQVGGRVTHRIDGWPAAMWMKVGFGELLLTTLDAGAWVEPRVSEETTLEKTSDYQTRLWGNSLALDVHVPTLDKPLEQTADYPTRLMGNPVVPKSWIVAALGGFCALLAVLGAWRAFAGDMTLLGLIAPIVSVAFGAGLVFASTLVRQEQTETVARLQLIQVAEDGQFALVREQAAVYLTSSADMQLEGQVDGRADVEGELASGIERFEIRDFQNWALKNGSWPPGVWRYRSGYSLPTEDLVAVAKLSDSDVQITLPNLPSPMEDAVLNYAVSGPMLLNRTGEGFAADGSQDASGERWISGALISSEQQRRLEIYQEFFKTQERVQGLGHVLYGWTNVWPGGPSWTKDISQKGAALVALPVRLEQPAVDQSIFVPHGFVQIRRDLNHSSSTFAFSDVTGKWEKELTMAVEARIQIVLPRELLPFDAESLELKVDMKAPQRDVRLAIDTEGGLVEVASMQGPSIPFSHTITDPLVLDDARDGVLDVVLEVGERLDLAPGQTSSTVVAWQVDDMQASFRGSRQSAANP